MIGRDGKPVRGEEVPTDPEVEEARRQLHAELEVLRALQTHPGYRVLLQQIAGVALQEVEACTKLTDVVALARATGKYMMAQQLLHTVDTRIAALNAMLAPGGLTP